MLKKVRLLLLALCPSKLKILILRRSGHKIADSCHIGIVWLDVQRLDLASGTRISNWNYFKGLRALTMGMNARIGGAFNWFTAAPLHQHENNQRFGILSIGDGTNITARHFFDVQHGISIGSNCLIAGYGSAFWTHGYRGFAKSRDMSVTIGDYCYIGSQVIFSPGSAVGNMSFVGTGAVVSRDFSDKSYAFIAGNPADIRKTLSEDEEFFTQDHRGFKPE